MPPDDNIYLERDSWRGYLTWSAGLHVLLFGSIIVYSSIISSQHGENWGNTEIGEAMSATLVSRAAVPLPAQPEQTQNVVANESKGLTESPPKAVEQQPEALPIPEREVKKKPEQHTSPEKPRIPPPQDNRVPFGEGGPVSGPYGVFTANNAKGGFSFTGAAGDFGSQFGWYVQVVQRKVSENWLKYEVDPTISSARRVYIVFDILSSGEPTNIQIEQSSGVPSLDQSATRALQRIDTFGPLPPGYRGSKVSVEFWFDYKRQ
ncbi:MAG TPA: cell envelope integrity protein TolA [Terriglobales bacterium]|nr:cell envelope integrity protein TolA [Terriglobales bacterium]